MNKAQVLLADDHAVVRAGIRDALQGLPNLEIIGEAGSGPELFAVLEETNPDCLLIDVTMPDFEPIAAIRRIRSNFPAMKILVISAYDDDIYVQGLMKDEVIEADPEEVALFVLGLVDFCFHLDSLYPNSIDPERPERFLRLAFRGLQNNVMSTEEG